jgi:hypothetical protein
MLFPLSFYYFFLVSKGIIPPFLGGYLVVVSAVLFIPAAVVSWFFRRSKYRLGEREAVELLYWGFLTYYLIVFAVNYWGRGLPTSNAINHLANLIYFTLIFNIFRGMDLRAKFFSSVNSFLLYGWQLIVMLNMSEGRFILPIENADLSGGHVSYQFLGLVYMIITAVYLINQESLAKRYMVILFSIVFLFVNGARSELFGFFVLFSVLEFLRSEKKRLFTFNLFLVGLTAILGLAIYWDKLINVNNRVIELLINRGGSSSSLARLERLEQGIVVIDRNVLFGGMSAYPSNEYIHNILSVWQDTGIIGFVLFLSIVILPVIFSLNSTIKGNERGNDSLVISLGLTCILLLLVSKAYFYLLVPAYIGIFCNNLCNHNYPRYKEKLC